MASSIYYLCNTVLNPEATQSVISFVNQKLEDYHWWGEPIILYTGNDGSLQGSTKLFFSEIVFEYTDDPERCVEIEVAITWATVKNILTILSEVAVEFLMNWDIEMEGEPFGQIQGNEHDQILFKMADSFLIMADIDTDKATKILEELKLLDMFDKMGK